MVLFFHDAINNYKIDFFFNTFPRTQGKESTMFSVSSNFAELNQHLDQVVSEVKELCGFLTDTMKLVISSINRVNKELPLSEAEMRIDMSDFLSDKILNMIENASLCISKTISAVNRSCNAI